MATAKKAVSKKAATKKPAVKKTAVIKPLNDPMLVSLNAPQQKSVEQIRKNQDRIDNAMGGMIKIAADSGARLVKLKEEVQKKFGRVWKVWAQTEGNLPVGYEQASRYMKLANNPALLEQINANSIEDAVKQIEHQLKPEKREAAEKQKAEKREQAKATTGQISEAVLNEIDECTDVQQLRGLMTLIQDRIEYLSDGNKAADPVDDIDDALEGEYTDDDDDADEAIAELTG